MVRARSRMVARLGRGRSNPWAASAIPRASASESSTGTQGPYRACRGSAARRGLHALDGVHAGDLPDGAHHVVELLHVDDLDLECGDRALLAVGARVGLQDVHAHV